MVVSRFLTGVLCLFGINAGVYGESQITQYGITWAFSEPVQFGKFVNGDYYVVDQGQGVEVFSVAPRPKGGINGSMINPVPKGGHGFDSRSREFRSRLQIRFPVTLHAGDVLLSSISLNGTEKRNWAGKKIGKSPHLKTVAVLTILNQHPPEGSFRPSYSDRSQRLFNVKQVRSELLPNLKNPSNLPDHPGFRTLEYFERGLERPWILFGTNWQSREIHPTENMHDYHQDIGFFLSEASLLLMTDISDKDLLLLRYIQVGIDYYFNGTADSSAWSWPLVFTGLMLGESEIHDFWLNNPEIRTERGHEKLYYVDDVRVSTISRKIPIGKTWVDWTTRDGRYVAFRKQIGQEYEHLHPSEWRCYSPHCKSEVYRAQHDVYPLVGMILSSILVDRMIDMDVNSKLAHDPIRDYCDRWMSNIFNVGKYESTGRSYYEEMITHQSFKIYFLRYGSGGSKFIDEMWTAYR